MLKKDWDDLANNGGKGDWYFSNEDTLITLQYGETIVEGSVTLPIRRPDERVLEANLWQWDGNREAPTLHPSILVTGKDHQWHGYLQQGKLVEA